VQKARETENKRKRKEEREKRKEEGAGREGVIERLKLSHGGPRWASGRECAWNDLGCQLHCSSKEAIDINSVVGSVVHSNCWDCNSCSLLQSVR